MKVEVSEDVLAALLEAARRNGDADSLDEAVRLLQVMGPVTYYARAHSTHVLVVKKLKSIFTPIPCIVLFLIHQIYGVEPPAALVRYLAPAQYGNGGPRSALYDRIYGRDGSQVISRL